MCSIRTFNYVAEYGKDNRLLKRFTSDVFEKEMGRFGVAGIGVKELAGQLLKIKNSRHTKPNS